MMKEHLYILRKEAEILSALNHPNIVKFKHVSVKYLWYLGKRMRGLYFHSNGANQRRKFTGISSKEKENGEACFRGGGVANNRETSRGSIIYPFSEYSS